MYHHREFGGAADGFAGAVISLFLILALVMLLICAFLIVMGTRLIINGFLMAPRGSKCRRWLWGSLVGWLGPWGGVAVGAYFAGPVLAQGEPTKSLLVGAMSAGLVSLVVLLITAKVAVTIFDELYQSKQTPAAVIDDIVHPGSWWQLAS